MSLLTKFSLLILLFGLALAGAIGVADWTSRAFYREVTVAFTNVTELFQQLDGLKQDLEREVQAIDPDIKDDQKPTSQYGDPQTLESSVAVRLGELDFGASDILRQAGASTLRAVRERATTAASKLQTAYQSRGQPGFQPQFAAAKVEFEVLHTLIERTQKHLLEDVQLRLVHGDEVQRLIRRANLAAFLIALMASVLAVLLFRRWVVTPVLALRKATEQLSAGHFEYRVAVTSKDELGALSHEVNDMADTIVEYQARLVERERLAAIGEMLRRIVHNLRNPLAGIRSLAELTRSSLPAESDDRENQDRIVATVDRFEHWLREVLQSTAPLEVHVREQPVRSLLEQVVNTHSVVTRAKDLDVEITCDPEFQARFDAVHLEHALSALVGNAMDASPRASSIRITVGAKNGTRWDITVEDAGSGIEPELRDQIFVPYFTTKPNGTGIGLALVHNVAQSHGGHVTVGDSELGGARFLMTLPR